MFGLAAACLLVGGSGAPHAEADGKTVISVGGGLTGTFTGLGEGGLVDNFGGEDLFITYQGGDGNDVALFTAVPEPATMMLLTVGGLAILRRRKR